MSEKSSALVFVNRKVLDDRCGFKLTKQSQIEIVWRLIISKANPIKTYFLVHAKHFLVWGGKENYVRK